MRVKSLGALFLLLWIMLNILERRTLSALFVGPDLVFAQKNLPNTNWEKIYITV